MLPDPVQTFLAFDHLGLVIEFVCDVGAPIVCTSHGRVIVRMLEDGTYSLMWGWLEIQILDIPKILSLMELNVFICKHKPLHRSDD
jgi:hypothetical protein